MHILFVDHMFGGRNLNLTSSYSNSNYTCQINVIEGKVEYFPLKCRVSKYKINSVIL